MFNFFRSLLGYKDISENKTPQENIEEEENSNSKEYSSNKIQENKIQIEDFDIFFKLFEDELLSKDELNVIYNGIDMDNVLFNVSKTISQAKYEEFMKILEKTKIEKKNNYNLELTGITCKLCNDNFFEKEYILKFTYNNFETFYENWGFYSYFEITLLKEEFKIIFDKLLNLSYTTEENETKFIEIKNILKKIGKKKLENGNKILKNIMFLGTSFTNNIPKNVYTLFFY